MMEVLQCDGCDFRAETHDELKVHIQDVHTVFLQPADLGTESPQRSDSLNSFGPTEEDEEDVIHNQCDVPQGDTDSNDFGSESAHVSGSKQTYSQRSNPSAKTSNPFFQCKFCIRYFRSKPLLDEHTKKIHGFSARPVHGRSNSLDASKLNVMMRGVDKLYSCQYCTYKSPRRARLLKHQRSHHKVTFFKHAPVGADVEPEVLDVDSDVPEEHSILSSMIKPRSKGSFDCEWCGFQASQRQQLFDHMIKKHRNMVKIMESLQQSKADGSAGSSRSDSPRSTPTSNLMSMDLSANEGSSSRNSSSPKVAKQLSNFQYSQISGKIPNSTGSSILSKRFSSDASNSRTGHESRLTNDSQSSSENEAADGTTYREAPPSADDSAKLLLSEEENKLLTEGILIQKHLNMFQCPFCSFVAKHRRSISQHIENIHLSNKSTLYNCNECPFFCTSQTQLLSHKRSHCGSTPEWEIMDLTNEGQENHSEDPEPGYMMNGKKSAITEEEKELLQCSFCKFSTTTLKGLRVHQQNKHSYCDGMEASVRDDEQQDSESESFCSTNFVQKMQTSILGFSSRKHAVGKTARKSINDLPLDLSPVKKRTRIDEIANNLQSKISQIQQHDDVINLEDVEDDEDENEAHMEISERDDPEIQSQRFAYNTPHLYIRQPGYGQAERSMGKRKRSVQASGNVPIQVAVSDDEENFGDSKDLHDQGREVYQEGTEYTAEPGNLFYCKHCEYQNKSARSVSTHYQRMHPYIKFSFKYILDPEDQSAVFRCLECFVEYNNFSDLHQHYMDHHPEASNVLNFNQPDLVYTCRFCSYTSPNVRSLMPHYQRMHPSVKINNAMIFSSYVVDQPQKGTTESQTLREILNSGPKNFSSSRSSSSPALKNASKTPDSGLDGECFKESLDGNVVVYNCDMCSFASPNMHSVLVHYQKKHPEQKASYFRIQKTMRVVTADKVQSVSNSSYNLSSTPKSTNALPQLSLEEEVYYCKHCIYNNRSVVGVLVHYQKRHPEIKVTAKYIKHAPPTPGLMKLMEELQIAPPKQFLKPFSASAMEGANNLHPKSVSDKVEGEMLFFCQHCDYGNRTVKGVLIHYQKKHRDVKANADLVRRHTAVVRSQRERAQMIQTGSSTSTSTSTSDSEKPKPLRSLKCRHCIYTSPYVYALKKHLKKDHPTVKATAMTILRWAYQDSVLDAGYHCEWCIYSHAEPSGLLMHYQRRHPEHNVDYAYMASKLWAGPDTSTSRQVGSAEIKHYQCRDCAFEACSVWDITNHYQAVHPWAIKNDESVLIDIIKGNSSPENMATQIGKGNSSMSNLFNSHPSDEGNPEIGRAVSEHHPQISFSNSSSISSNPYQCTVCLSEYNSLHGLLTHYGKKHPGMKVKAADFAQEADINPSSVYKCRHCPYVNSRIHGVLTHYQKRHPLVKVTAEDFADDIEEVKDLVTDADERAKSQRQGYGAYRCKLCPYSHGTLEKLKIHYEKYHNQSVSEIFSKIQVRTPAGKDDSVAEYSVNSVTETSEASHFDEAALAEFTKVEKHTLFKCQLCKYFCSTRKGIARHYRIKHNNVRAQPEGKNNVFKCALCSYTNPIRKGLAAHYQKRHDIDAYYTHCLAASKSFTDKPNKVTLPLVSQVEGSAMSEELRQAVERRKCSLCSFQAFSRKSIISHYVKRHPGVFPKKQSTSKLGRYFTVIYPKEPEPAAGEQDFAAVEVKEEGGDRDEAEWMPLKCRTCSELTFDAADSLVTHYNNCHSGELKRDFMTIESPLEEGVELYQCTHCEIKFLELPELSVHLSTHIQEFEKRVPPRGLWRSFPKSKESGVLKPEPKMTVSADRTPIGYRCNFCVEMHPTLRAICNHLRKHVQYGENKAAGAEKKEEVQVSDVTQVNGGMEEPTADVEDGGSVPPAEELVEADVSSRGPEHRCGACDRVFMSMQGLRSHERSHSATALINREDKYSCQYCQFQSAFRHNLDRHVQSHHGQHKPFRCKLCPFKSAYLSRLKSHLHKSHAGENTYKCISCPFSTMTISQLKEHLLREHGEALTLPRLRAGTTPRSTHTHPDTPTDTPMDTPTNSEAISSDADVSDSVSYLEPLDVQQQLSHYQLASRNQAPPTVLSASPDSAPSVGAESVGSALGRSDCFLSCEFCEFSSGYMQSLRRHYRDRHGGKKLFKCKDCSFFTCYKSTFTLHVEAGHGGQSEEVIRELRCPFCLYHTKSKSHMIDHVLLHREERVIPLEVSRSKLSRHLDGLIFRCHKCTFTCSSDENLQQHISKHEEPKPYECQLCYYDTKQQQQLEEHLRDEHKVIRNFELIGRVNLDQLDALKERSLSEDEEEEREEAMATEEEEEEEEEQTEEPERDEEAAEEEDELEEEVAETQEKGKQEVEATAESSAGTEGAGAGVASVTAAVLSSSPDKRFPCEFCGRTFSMSTEWERHVLRHGMTVSSNARAGSSIISPTVTDRDTNQSAATLEVEQVQESDQSEGLKEKGGD